MKSEPREAYLRAMREIDLERQARETGEDPQSFIRVSMVLKTEWFGQECIEAEQEMLLSTDCSSTDMLLTLMNRKVLEAAQLLLHESIRALEERLVDEPEEEIGDDYPPIP